MFANQPFDPKQCSILIKEGNERVIPEPDEPVRDRLPGLPVTGSSTISLKVVKITMMGERVQIRDREPVSGQIDPLFLPEGDNHQPQSPSPDNNDIDQLDDPIKDHSTLIKPRQRSGRRTQKPNRLIDTMNANQKSYHYLHRSRKC